jgi:hypothetical protein
MTRKRLWRRSARGFIVATLKGLKLFRQVRGEGYVSKPAVTKALSSGRSEVLVMDDDCPSDLPAEEVWAWRNSGALLSESALAKDWLTSEEDEAWQDL